jgi:hypothetical protein
MRAPVHALPGALVLLVLLASAAAAEPPPKLNPKLLQIAPNRWLKLHEQKPTDPLRFRRQAHGGSCFDTKRGRLILFGSDTHGRSWLNAPRFFDPVAARWSRAYPDDKLETYKVNAAGIPVAGPDGAHPWTMHTFGAVIYDPTRDEMVVCCHPGHMVPGRFTNVVRHLWGRIKRHPTWTYSPAGGRWTPLPCRAVSFFPFAAALDTDRNVIIGYRSEGIHELGGGPRTWKRITGPGLFTWHNNCVYDAKHKALVVFGTSGDSNDVVVYRPATGEHRKMPTPGVRPPADQHNPMAFEPRIGRTAVVVDRVHAPADATRAQRAKAGRTAELWLYDLGKDAWQQVPTAALPFGCGMNYNMEYDPYHRVLLLVTGGYGQPTTVWALRVELAKPSEPKRP